MSILLCFEAKQEKRIGSNPFKQAINYENFSCFDLNFQVGDKDIRNDNKIILFKYLEVILTFIKT